VIDVTPCNTYSLSVPVQPSDLVLDREIISGSTTEQAVTPSLSNLFVSSNSLCPITDFDLLDNSGVVLADSNVIMQGKTTPSSTSLVIANTRAFNMAVRLKAISMTKNTYMSFNIRVCGTESLSLANTEIVSFVYGQVTGSTSGMSDSTRYFSLP